MTYRKGSRAKKNESAKEPLTFTDRLISMAEKDRFTVLTGFIYLLILMLARAWIEGRVFGYGSLNLNYFAWQATFFASAFMGGVMVLALFSEAGFRKSCNVTMFTFWIILLPPLLDHFVFGITGMENAGTYNYLTKDTIINFILPFMGDAPGTWGLRIMGLYVFTSVGLFLWYKTRSPARSLLGILGISSLMLFLAARPFIITTEAIPMITGGVGKDIVLLSYFRFPVLNYYGWLPDPELAPALISQQRVLLYVAYNLIIFVLFFILALLASSREKFRGFMESIRGLRHGHFIMMCFLGVIMVRTIDLAGLQHPLSHPAYLALDPMYILHLPYILLIALSMAFAWQFTTMLNDMYDLKIDRVAHPERSLVKGTVTTDEYRQLAMMFGILALCTSTILGIIPFILITAFLVLGVIYSVPPVRFRDNTAGSLIIGLGSILAYFIGVYSPGHWEVIHWDVVNNQVVNEIWLFYHRVPPLTGDILLVGVMILIALTLAPMMTQMRDYEGDVKAGVRSIFTVLGFEKGRRIVCVLVPLLFLMPLAVINQIWDVLLLSSLALISHVILLRSRNIMPVFAIYFAAAIYTLLRILL